MDYSVPSLAGPVAPAPAPLEQTNFLLPADPVAPAALQPAAESALPQRNSAG